MLLTIILVILGLVFVLKGADLFVDSASAIAKKFNISELAIGLTIVAFGTSAPELVVNVFASVQDHQEIVLGNIIGSNNFNLFIILGLTAILFPVTVQSNTAWKEIPFSFFAVIIVFILINDQLFSFADYSILKRYEGLILLFFFVLFMLYVYKQLKNDNVKVDLEKKQLSTLKIIIYIILGLTGLIAGGKLVVNNAIKLAVFFNISEKIIGLTIVSIGTSLPELATSVVAAIKKNSDIAIGNIIGSNIFNLLLVLALSSIIQPIHYDTRFNIDLFILIGGTLFLFIAMYTGKRKKLDRWEGIILFSFYLGYMIYLVFV